MKRALVFLLMTMSIVSVSQKRHDKEMTHSDSVRERSLYLYVAFDCDGLFPRQTIGSLGVNIPYTATNQQGTTNQSFNKTISPAFSSPIKTFGFTAQLGKKNHFFTFAAGGGYHNNYGLVGYGRMLNVRHPYKDRFIFKASLDFGAYSLGSKTMGTIDNTGKNISIMGLELDSTYQYQAGQSSQTVTENARQTRVSFFSREIIFQPKFIVEYHPFKGSFYVAATVMYFLPVSEKGEVRFIQTNGGSFRDGDGIVAPYKNAGGVYNQKPASGTPISFSGFQFSISLGFSTYDYVVGQARSH